MRELNGNVEIQTSEDTGADFLEKDCEETKEIEHVKCCYASLDTLSSSI